MKHQRVISVMELFARLKKQPLQMFFKPANLKAYNLIEKKLQHRYLPMNIAKYFRTAFL